MKVIRITAIFLILAGIIISCSHKNFHADMSGRRLKPYDTAAFNYIFVEAVKQKLLGNGGDALKLLENSLIVNPRSDAAYFQMAQILIASGNLEKGKQKALSAYNLDPDNFWYLVMLAGTYYELKNTDSASIFYEKAVKKFPDRDDIKVTLANIYSEKSEFLKALELFKILDNKYGINRVSSSGSVKNLMWAGKWTEAKEITEKLITLYPEEILFKGLLAEIYRGMGDFPRAEGVYKQLIDQNPGNAQVQLALCDFMIEEKKFDDLVILLNTVAINDKVSRTDKISLFAQLIENEELIKENGETFLFSVMVLESAYPADEIIVLLKPELFLKTGRNKEAATRLEEIIRMQPQNYFAWEKLLLAYLQDKDYINLESRSRECATKFNRSYLAKLLYATAAIENGNYEIALEELRKADILAGSDEEMLLQSLSLRADVYYRMKNFEKAFETFEQALAKKKDDLILLNNYAYYLAEKDLNLKEAEKMAERVTTLEPGNNTFLDTYAWVLYKRGKYRNAEKVMNQIFKSTDKDDAEYYEHYGFILKKLRKCDEAVAAWTRAVEADKTKIHLEKEIENCKK
ncbi:MAG TPA: tetratricopeptide repeat protein [Bacteroidales bacterium]|nr:tetratricopeptide repeat protein [Bacteroidales bacterium]